MAIRSFLFSAAAFMLVGAPSAAQTAAASRPPAAATAMDKSAPGRWTCASRTTVEIAPVSFDSSGNAEAWVMVHRIKGEVVAAERIDGRDAAKLRNMACSDQVGAALVG